MYLCNTLCTVGFSNSKHNYYFQISKYNDLPTHKCNYIYIKDNKRYIQKVQCLIHYELSGNLYALILLGFDLVAGLNNCIFRAIFNFIKFIT